MFERRRRRDPLRRRFSVAGGVEPLVGDEYAGVISLDLKLLNSVLEVDNESRAALIEGRIYGPALRRAHRTDSRSVTIRSRSSSQPWAAGSQPGRGAITPPSTPTSTSSWKVSESSLPRDSSRHVVYRPPGSAPPLSASSAGRRGPSESSPPRGCACRIALHSERRHRSRSAPPRCCIGRPGAGPVRPLPDQLSRPRSDRARLSGVGDGDESILIVAFESADHPVEPWSTRAAEICRDCGGVSTDGRASADTRVAAWRDRFIDSRDDTTRSSRSTWSAGVSKPQSHGIASRSSTKASHARPWMPPRKSAARASCHAASPTSIPTVPHRITQSSLLRVGGTTWLKTTRSKRLPLTRSCDWAARSRTIMRSHVTTGSGMTSSVPICLPSVARRQASAGPGGHPEPRRPCRSLAGALDGQPRSTRLGRHTRPTCRGFDAWPNACIPNRDRRGSACTQLGRPCPTRPRSWPCSARTRSLPSANFHRRRDGSDGGGRREGRAILQ